MVGIDGPEPRTEGGRGSDEGAAQGWDLPDARAPERARARGDGGGAGDTGEDGIIRFTFAPDPVWDYLKDSGIREEMEAESGIRIIEQASWDEFGLYAGGHADIVSIASFEVPLLEEETGNPATVFGKYNIRSEEH